MQAQGWDSGGASCYRFGQGAGGRAHISLHNPEWIQSQQSQGRWSTRLSLILPKYQLQFSLDLTPTSNFVMCATMLSPRITRLDHTPACYCNWSYTDEDTKSKRWDCTFSTCDQNIALNPKLVFCHMRLFAPSLLFVFAHGRRRVHKCTSNTAPSEDTKVSKVHKTSKYYHLSPSNQPFKPNVSSLFSRFQSIILQATLAPHFSRTEGYMHLLRKSTKSKSCDKHPSSPAHLVFWPRFLASYLIKYSEMQSQVVESSDWSQLAPSRVLILRPERRAINIRKWMIGLNQAERNLIVLWINLRSFHYKYEFAGVI